MPADLITRIRNIQKQLALAETGIIDMATCQALEIRLNITVTSNNVVTHIKNIQRALRIGDDGIVGPITVSRIEALITTRMPAIPQGASMVVSVKSLDLIISSEITSREMYNRKYQSPIWPGGDSGITIGIGYDCGYATRNSFTAAWQTHISVDALNLLLATCGKKGASCQSLLPGLSRVKIPYDAALQVFYQTTLPSYARDTRRAFPGIEKLPPDAQGALLSLVYNRGAAIDNSDRRREMKAIVALVADGNLAGIAAQIRSMKRLWDPAKQKGLLIRRDKEADLVAQATFDVLPEDVIVV